MGKLSQVASDDEDDAGPEQRDDHDADE